MNVCLKVSLRAERVLKVDPQSDRLDVRTPRFTGDTELPVADAEHVDRTEGRAHRPLYLAVDVLGLARDALVCRIEGAPRRCVVVGDDVPDHLLDEDRRVSTRLRVAFECGDRDQRNADHGDDRDDESHDPNR